VLSGDRSVLGGDVAGQGHPGSPGSGGASPYQARCAQIRRDVSLYKAARKAAVNSSRVSRIGFAFMLLAFAAFSTSSAMWLSVMP
jgi:selenophosphate synthetase-related protein